MSDKPALPSGPLLIVEQEDHARCKPAVSGFVSPANEFVLFHVVDGNTAQALDDPVDDPFLVREIR
jgi:hypothetical protein